MKRSTAIVTCPQSELSFDCNTGWIVLPWIALEEHRKVHAERRFDCGARLATGDTLHGTAPIGDRLFKPNALPIRPGIRKIGIIEFAFADGAVLGDPHDGFSANQNCSDLIFHDFLPRLCPGERHNLSHFETGVGNSV